MLWAGFVRVAGQLEYLSQFEPCLFDDFEAESGAVLEAYAHASTAEFIDTVGRYHQRRVSAAAALAALAYLRREEELTGERLDSMPGGRALTGGPE